MKYAHKDEAVYKRFYSSHFPEIELYDLPNISNGALIDFYKQSIKQGYDCREAVLATLQMGHRLREGVEKWEFPPKHPEENKTAEQDKPDYAKELIRIMEAIPTNNPKPEDLGNHSQHSRQTWGRRFADAIFIASLLKEFQKKINHSKKPEKREFWQNAELYFSEMINTLKSDASNRETVPYDDTKRAVNPYEDLNESYAEQIR